MPLCDEHSNSLDAGWLIFVMAGGFFLGFICLVIGALTGIWVLAGVGAVVAVVSVVIILVKTMLRKQSLPHTSMIDEDFVVIENVDPDFAEAVLEMNDRARIREGPPGTYDDEYEEEDERPRRKKRRRDEEDDDEPPRRKRRR